MVENKKRILLVDDNTAIHEDFKQILSVSGGDGEERSGLEQDLFGDDMVEKDEKQLEIEYVIDDAYQGEDAIKMVEDAEKEGFPYALIFMDVRMPPGIDGIQTVQKIWESRPYIEIVICTAHSDYSWDEILKKFGSTDHLLFIQKPFNSVTIKQIALTMTTKWQLDRDNRGHIKNLESRIKERTQNLQELVKEKEGFISAIREEMTLAEIVQKQLLPTKLPDYSGVEIATHYVPTEKIGGDLYDVIPLDDDRLAFLIFDVSGHGIAAALVTAIGKFSFNQHIKNTKLPNEVLTLVNNDICDSTPAQMYITAFLLIVNTKTMDAVYSGAGHIPQIHFQKEQGAIQDLFGRGLFLGIEKETTYVENHVKFKDGDRLFFYTDGLTETINNDDKLFGRKRIKEIVIEMRSEKIEKVVGAIIKKNEEFMEDQPRYDDVCLVGIKINKS